MHKRRAGIGKASPWHMSRGKHSHKHMHRHVHEHEHRTSTGTGTSFQRQKFRGNTPRKCPVPDLWVGRLFAAGGGGGDGSSSRDPPPPPSGLSHRLTWTSTFRESENVAIGNQHNEGHLRNYHALYSVGSVFDHFGPRSRISHIPTSQTPCPPPPPPPRSVGVTPLQHRTPLTWAVLC